MATWLNCVCCRGGVKVSGDPGKTQVRYFAECGPCYQDRLRKEQHGEDCTCERCMIVMRWHSDAHQGAQRQLGTRAIAPQKAVQKAQRANSQAQTWYNTPEPENSPD